MITHDKRSNMYFVLRLRLTKTYLVDNGVEEIECVSDRDIPQLGVVWRAGHLQGFSPTHYYLITLHVEQSDCLVHILGYDGC